MSKVRTTLDQERHALATSYTVLGTRGRTRVVLIVARCPFCGHVHVHTAKAGFEIGKRTPACHRGRYTLHAITSTAVAA